MKENPSANILLIGNELLRGDVQDMNGWFLLKALRKLHIPVFEMRCVRDIIPDIEEAIHDLCPKADYLFTIGGIGPTHDDVTIEAVAKATQKALVPNPDLQRLAESYTRSKNLPLHAKMILAPEDCSILTQQPNTGPGVIRINNIFVCPGVPHLLQKSIDVILPYLKSATPIQQKNIYLNCDEITIVETLNQHAQRFPKVEIGSYILSSSQTPALELSFCSYDRDQLESCIQSFVDELPTGISFS